MASGCCIQSARQRASFPADALHLSPARTPGPPSPGDHAPRLCSPSFLHPKPSQHGCILILRPCHEISQPPHAPEFDLIWLPGAIMCRLTVWQSPTQLFKRQCKCHFLCEVIPTSTRLNQFSSSVIPEQFIHNGGLVWHIAH